MPAVRRTYNDNDRARVYAELTINEGNVKRTARHLELPVSTVRHFKTRWEAEGLSPGEEAQLPAVIDDFVVAAERVRDKALLALEIKVEDGTLTGAALVATIGMLQDKVRAIKGLDVKRVEHTLELPNADEIRGLFSGVIGELVGAAHSRAVEIEDADWEPAHALPPASLGG